MQCVLISATKKLGLGEYHIFISVNITLHCTYHDSILDELEQAIILQADDMGLYADATGGDAVLLESYKDPRYDDEIPNVVLMTPSRYGAVMVALVKNGKIKVGDHYVAGTYHG